VASPGRLEWLKQRSDFGDVTGRLARKSIAANVSFFVCLHWQTQRIVYQPRCKRNSMTSRLQRPLSAWRIFLTALCHLRIGASDLDLFPIVRGRGFRGSAERAGRRRCSALSFSRGDEGRTYRRVSRNRQKSR